MSAILQTAGVLLDDPVLATQSDRFPLSFWSTFVRCLRGTISRGQIGDMHIRYGKDLILVSSVLCTLASISSADSGAYLGFGLNSLEMDGPRSENISFTAGYDVYERRFESTGIQSVKLGIEGQYSDSISGTDNVNNYSVFGALRAHTSNQIYLKVKQGFTEFLGDVTTMNTDAEHSHFGIGVGVGYEMPSGFIEAEYIRPNESIHASIFEISYKFHF